MVRTLSPYKDYSSLLRWQANLCVYIATMDLCRQRYVVIFVSVQLILLLMKIMLVVCGFIRTFRAVNVSLLLLKILVVCK
jgi:hypothetical protein